MLSGRKGKYGLLRKYGGKLLKPGIIEIVPETENLFLEKIKMITTRFKVRRAFIYNN